MVSVLEKRRAARGGARYTDAKDRPLRPGRCRRPRTVPCPCGQSTRPLTGADTPTCNLHVTFITDSAKHYHKECTEVYYILEGQGKMELNGDVIVGPGTVVLVEPYTAHRLWSEAGMRAIVVGVPACRPDDEYGVA